jgi:hypothetical protein
MASLRSFLLSVKGIKKTSQMAGFAVCSSGWYYQMVTSDQLQPDSLLQVKQKAIVGYGEYVMVFDRFFIIILL